MNFLNLYQIKILSILSCSIIPLLVTGPFLPDLVLSLLSLWFIYYIFRNNKLYLFKNKFFYIFIAFWLFCMFSSLLSDDIFLSFESSLFYFRIGIFCLLISYLIDQDKVILKYFFYTLIITFCFLIFYALIEYFFKLNQHQVRISSLFGDELILGSYLSRLLPLIIGLFLIKRNKTYLEKNIFIIFLALTYFCILLSGERSAFFYVNMSLLFIFIFVKINFKLLFSFLIIFVIFFTTFIITANYNKTGENLITRYTVSVISSMNLDRFIFKDNKNEKVDKKLSINNSDKSNNSSNKDNRIILFTDGHETLYRTAFNMFLDRPIIGHGPKLFRVKCSDPKYSEIVGSSDRGLSSCMTHPHHFYVQLLAETGIIGFSFLFSIFIYVIFLSAKYFYYNLIKKKKIYSNYQICLLACILITVWPLVPNGNFFNNYLMIIYSLPLGFLKKEIKF